MLPALSIAANGMAVQSQRLDGIAAAVASTGATADTSANAPGGGAPVRVASLPVGDPIENMVSMNEVESAYRLNAAVFATADEMLKTLIDVIQPGKCDSSS
jgi:flagellar basal body rod protein FlgG